MKKCPFCAEEIKDEAVKCRYCGEWFDKRRTGPIDKNSGGHDLNFMTDEVTHENVTAKRSTENNSQRNDEGNPEVSHDYIDQTISTKLEVLDLIENSFRIFKKLILMICFFPTIFGVIVASINPSKPLLDIIILCGGLVIIITACFILYYLWSCARLVGSNPLLYVLVSVFLPMIIGTMSPAASDRIIPA